jgi:hypothetical protein
MDDQAKRAAIKEAATKLRVFLRCAGETSIGYKRARAVEFAVQCGLTIEALPSEHLHPTVATIIEMANQQ